LVWADADADLVLMVADDPTLELGGFSERQKRQREREKKRWTRRGPPSARVVVQSSDLYGGCIPWNTEALQLTDVDDDDNDATLPHHRSYVHTGERRQKGSVVRSVVENDRRAGRFG
jgi:hypothetical protein